MLYAKNNQITMPKAWEKWEAVFPRDNAEHVCAEIMLKQKRDDLAMIWPHRAFGRKRRRIKPEVRSGPGRPAIRSTNPDNRDGGGLAMSVEELMSRR